MTCIVRCTRYSGCSPGPRLAEVLFLITLHITDLFEYTSLSNTSHPHSVTTQPFWIWYFIFMVSFGQFPENGQRQMAYIIYLIKVSSNKYKEATALKLILHVQ